MTEQPSRLKLSLVSPGQDALLPCLNCDHPIPIQNPIEKFTRFTKVPCRRCGQQHRVDLFFQGENDFCHLIPVAA